MGFQEEGRGQGPAGSCQAGALVSSLPVRVCKDRPQAEGPGQAGLCRDHRERPARPLQSIVRHGLGSPFMGTAFQSGVQLGGRAGPDWAPRRLRGVGSLQAPDGLYVWARPSQVRPCTVSAVSAKTPTAPKAALGRASASKAQRAGSLMPESQGLSQAPVLGGSSSHGCRGP